MVVFFDLAVREARIFKYGSGTVRTFHPFVLQVKNSPVVAPRLV